MAAGSRDVLSLPPSLDGGLARLQPLWAARRHCAQCPLPPRPAACDTPNQALGTALTSSLPRAAVGPHPTAAGQMPALKPIPRNLLPVTADFYAGQVPAPKPIPRNKLPAVKATVTP